MTVGFWSMVFVSWSSAEILGVWNFFRRESGDPTQVPNDRQEPGGRPAQLRDFAPQVLQGVDAELGDFSISRQDLETTVQVAKTGWGTFQAIPDNGLLPGVNTPVGDHALAIKANKNKTGNWVYFPKLAEDLVGRPGGSTRSFGFAAWYLLQTKQKKFLIYKVNPLFRLGSKDARIQTFSATSRFLTEDVGNGLGKKHSYQFPHVQDEPASSRWFHLVISADGKSNRFQAWVNGQPVKYLDRPGFDHYSWPARGGMKINYRQDRRSNGGVIGRWMGGSGGSIYTMGLAAVVVLKDEPFSQEKAEYLYQLGRRGIPFEGRWFSKSFK